MVLHIAGRRNFQIQWSLALTKLNLWVLPSRELDNWTDLREAGCENGGWIEQAWNCVQWQAFVLGVPSRSANRELVN